jgi:hypothetical protein
MEVLLAQELPFHEPRQPSSIARQSAQGRPDKLGLESIVYAPNIGIELRVDKSVMKFFLKYL